MKHSTKFMKSIIIVAAVGMLAMPVMAETGNDPGTSDCLNTAVFTLDTDMMLVRGGGGGGGGGNGSGDGSGNGGNGPRDGSGNGPGTGDCINV